MPELPEVETIKRGLHDILIGLTITNVEIVAVGRFAEKYLLGDVAGKKVTDVKRRAKVLLIELDNNTTLMFHLKMTGQLIYHDKAEQFAGGHPIPPLNSPMPNSTTRVIFHFGNDGLLYFNDLRRFGWIFALPTKDVSEFPFFKTVGPEPFDEAFTSEQFAKNLLRRKNLIIKNALLDQTVIAGIGNIYADESLWLAHLHPKRIVSSLTGEELISLYDAIKESLTVGIKHKGSSSKTYVNHKGEAGTFLDYANAYHKTGLPCGRCQTLIIREKIGTRSAHYCPNCQRLR